MNTIEWLLNKSESMNLAVDIDDRTLEDIGQKVKDMFNLDDTSRAEWLADIEEYIDVAMQVAKEKSYPWEGAANINYPTLPVAALQFHARAYPAIVPSRGVVKGKVVGYDPEGKKTKRAERIGKHMSYQLMEEMEEWEADMDRGLMVMPIVGCFFKKTYYDPHKARNVSKAVWAQDLVIDYEAPSLERAPRKSEEFTLYPQEVIERVRSGLWVDTDISFKSEEDDTPEEFIEQHTSWDLDDDGYKEPYVITVHKESGDVVRIVARYDEDSLFYKDDDKLVSVGQKRREIKKANAEIKQNNMIAAAIADGAMQATNYSVKPSAVSLLPAPNFDGKQIAKIEPIEYYTVYQFLPSPDGSIYSMGFGKLLKSIGATTDTSINQMLDASSLSNLGGGFIAKSAKRTAGPQKAEVGEFVAVETNGAPLKDAILPFNFRGPSQQSFALVQEMFKAAQNITGIKDISSDMTSTTTATTAMIIQEEGTKVYNSLYKRIYRAAKSELQKLYRLNRKHLSEEAYYMVLDTAEAIKKEDYTADETDVVPVGDPTVASSGQRIIRAQALLPMAGDPDANGYEIKRRYLEALDVENIDEVLPPPSDKPNPMFMAEMQKREDEHNETVAKIAKLHADTIEKLASAEAKEVGNQIEIYNTQLQALLGGINNGQPNKAGVPGLAPAPGNQVAPQGTQGGATGGAGGLGGGPLARVDGQPA